MTFYSAHHRCLFMPILRPCFRLVGFSYITDLQPVIHQVQGRLKLSFLTIYFIQEDALGPLAAFTAPENLRYHDVSICFFRPYGCLPTPCSAHDIGKSDYENTFGNVLFFRAVGPNQTLWLSANPVTSSQPHEIYLKSFFASYDTLSLIT